MATEKTTKAAGMDAKTATKEVKPPSAEATLAAVQQDYHPDVEVVEYLIGTQFGLATDDQQQRHTAFKKELTRLLKDGYQIESDVTAPHPMGGSVAIYVLVKWTPA